LAKKIIPVAVIVFFLFAAIIALTDEPKTSSPDLKEAGKQNDFPFNSDFERRMPESGSNVYWFRSNAGGLTIEEVPSQFAALRNEYAIAVGFPHQDELPEYLLPFFDKEEHHIEIRMLYKKGEQIRTQWLFRDKRGTTRLNAVILEPAESDVQEEIQIEETDIEETDISDDEEKIVEAVAAGAGDKKVVSKKQKTGFIETYDEKSFLTCDYRFFEDGIVSKTDYVFKNNILISSKVSLKENNSGEYSETYNDFYRYNRSLSLRAIERIFYKDSPISAAVAPVLVSFPRHSEDAAKNGIYIGERHNSYPEFFGDVLIHADSKIVFDTDERGRILNQTLYDNKGNVVWIIRNKWHNNRIVSTSKTQGDTVLLAEYSYNSSGNRILERNLKNGVLERIVRTENKTDIEELYFNNVLVLRAVWEDGRKISEVRVK